MHWYLVQLHAVQVLVREVVRIGDRVLVQTDLLASLLIVLLFWYQGTDGFSSDCGRMIVLFRFFLPPISHASGLLFGGLVIGVDGHLLLLRLH